MGAVVWRYILKRDNVKQLFLSLMRIMLQVRFVRSVEDIEVDDVGGGAVEAEGGDPAGGVALGDTRRVSELHYILIVLTRMIVSIILIRICQLLVGRRPGLAWRGIRSLRDAYQFPRYERQKLLEFGLALLGGLADDR